MGRTLNDDCKVARFRGQVSNVEIPKTDTETDRDPIQDPATDSSQNCQSVRLELIGDLHRVCAQVQQSNINTSEEKSRYQGKVKSKGVRIL